MRSFWFILKQQWTIEEISIFSNSSHLERRVGLSDTILKGIHPGTIPARFGLIWFSGFRGEDLNVKVYDIRRTPKRVIVFNVSFNNISVIPWWSILLSGENGVPGENHRLAVSH